MRGLCCALCILEHFGIGLDREEIEETFGRCTK